MRVLQLELAAAAQRHHLLQERGLSRKGLGLQMGMRASAELPRSFRGASAEFASNFTDRKPRSQVLGRSSLKIRLVCFGVESLHGLGFFYNLCVGSLGSL